MKLYFGGAEIPSHKKTLLANGVSHVYLSFMGLRRRVKFARPWLIADKFPEDLHIMLDSGAYTVNRGVDDAMETGQQLEIATTYMDFVLRNAARVDAFTEFDAMSLGLDWVKTMRADFYDDFGDKFMPVWHAEYGVDELERMAGQYRRIAILQTALGDRDLAPTINLLAARRGTLFHGLACTKPEVMAAVRWDSVGSTSWVSPMQYGDTHVWQDGKFKRYPKDYKERGRQENRALFEREGFDADKILADDRAEVAKLTLWSWRQLVDDLNRHTDLAPEPRLSVKLSEGNPDLLPVGEERPAALQLPTPRPRKRVLLPGIELTRPEGSDNPQLSIRGDTLRRCDTCILRDRGCPGYEAGASCIYELPIFIRTPADVKALENGLIAMQTQRVMFMRMVEDLEGGHANPNLSGELDRLTRMIKLQREGSADKFSLSINASRQPGEAGILGSMFGQDVANAQAIKAPSAADTLIRESLMAPVYDITEVKDK